MAKSLSDQLNSMNPDYEKEISKYVDELKATAQGNYDFIVKFLKQTYQQALGTDDQKRLDFLDQVANKLETQIGRIPFDYDTKTTREKQDISNYLKRSKIQRQSLDTAEEQFKAQQSFATEQEQKQNAANFNARGLLGSGLQGAESRKLALARKLTQEDPFYAQQATQRAQLNQQDAEAQLQSQRNLEDITTDARRGAQDEQTNLDKGTEGAGLDLQAAQRAADAAGSQARQQAISAIAAQQAAEAARNEAASYYADQRKLNGTV